jgi:high affinity cGMP-specific 3',5'-cyclic phosphodiesterase 9
VFKTKKQLMKVLMKLSDISNECRPVSVSEVWLECLLVEFFNQSDHEKLNGLPISNNMDRDTFSKANSQVGFIQFLVIPIIEALIKIFPQISSTILSPVLDSLDYYKKMKENSIILNTNKNAKKSLISSS